MKLAVKQIAALMPIALVAQSGLANIVGGDTQNFNPAIGSSEFVTVQSTTPTGQGLFHLGLFVNHAVNSLPYQTNADQTRLSTNDAITGSDMFIGYGLLQNLDLGVSFPFVISQTLREGKTHGEFEETGNTDVRLSARYRFLKQGPLGIATVLNANINRTKNNPHTGANTSPLYSVELAADYGVGRATLGANIGYRFREPGAAIEGSLIDPLQNQALLSIAAAQKIAGMWTATTEIYMAQALTTTRNETNREMDIAEWLLGTRYQLGAATRLHAGAGTELAHGLSSPDWRAYAGVTTLLGAASKTKMIVQKKKKKNRRARLVKDYPTENPLAEVNHVPDEVFILDDIHFEFDSDFRILPGGLRELEKLMRRLEAGDYDKLIIEGHTDAYGSDEYNIDLSFRRARSVRRHLIKYHQVTAKEVMAIGYGENRPIADNISDRGRQENRRVEIKIYK